VAAQLGPDRLSELLAALTDVLDEAGQSSWASTTRQLGVALSRASSPGSRQEAVRRVLALFQGGMGSFNDVVLQNAQGVLPAQATLDVVRRQVFEEARRELT